MIGNKRDLVPFVVTSLKAVETSRGKNLVSLKTGTLNDLGEAISPETSVVNTGGTAHVPTPADDPVDQIKRLLGSVPGILVSDLKYVDLFFPAQWCNGIYLFYESEKLLYIGKCSSRAVIDRIGGHLTPRNSDMMNCFLKRLCVGNPPDLEGELDTVMSRVLGMKIKYIPVDSRFKDLIGILESYMIRSLSPCYNHSKQRP